MKRALKGLGSDRQRGRVFENDVRIRATKPKAAHPGQSSLRVSGPRRSGSWHTRGNLIPRNVRAGLSEMEMGRDFAMMQREHHFDEAGNPGGCFQMADVRLDRADKKRLRFRPPFAQ